MLSPLSIVLISLAAAASPADKGYIVRVDSNAVWIDLAASEGATPGRGFDVYTEGAELKHPVTGASLGKVENVVAQGRVLSISDKFSQGTILSRSATIAAGQRVRLSAPAVVSVAPRSAKLDTVEGRLPKSQGAMLNFSVNAMAIGDFDAAGKPQAALASENTVMLFAYPVTNSTPLASIKLPGTGLRILGLEAADMDASGRAALFVSVYDEAFQRFETRVLKMEAGKWLKAADLPFLTHGYQDPAGKPALATQQVLDDKSFPFGAIYPLSYADGKYFQGRPALKFPRVEWVFNFTTARLGEVNASLYLTTIHALRVQLGKEHWRTPDDDYGQTPLRVRWHERLLEFNPPMATTYGANGFDALYVVRNIPALGGLASPFGFFNRAELHRKIWNGLALETAWKAELPGAAQGLSVVETAAGREIAIAVRGSAGQSSIWTFDP